MPPAFPSPQRFVPSARPTGLVPSAAVPVATPVATPIAEPGDVLAGADAARYGRLTNPDLLVAASDWVSVQSTFLARIRFVPYAVAAEDEYGPVDQRQGDLYIGTNDGWVGVSRGRTYRDYRDYLQAPSKGKHHRAQPWYHAMETVTPQQYHGAELAARVAANG